MNLGYAGIVWAPGHFHAGANFALTAFSEVRIQHYA
jgi:hypothetical protein